MRYGVAARMEEPVTIAHLSGGVWSTATYARCAWQVVPERNVDAAGMVTRDDVLRVQIPEDVGPVEVALGDYLIRGGLSYSGDLAGLREVLPEGSRRVSSIRDLRGGLSGVSGALTRWASVLVLEAAR